LEALRGSAALIVVLCHSITGFLPQYYGYIPSLASDRLQGSVFYCFLNGSASVCLFFVLSGYILTRRYCESGDSRILLNGAIKRWPRLMGPVLVTVLISYSLFYFHLYNFQKAGIVSGSHWLVKFAGAFPPTEAPHAATPAIHYWDALLQGSFLTFFRGDWLFDSSLWTMQPELMGSFIAFGIAPILLKASKYSFFATIWLVLVTIAMLHFARPDLVAFPIGVTMAVLLPRKISLGRRFAYPALLLSLYLLGYPGAAVGAYTIFGDLANHGMPFVYPQIVGAAILISLIEIFPPLQRPFTGKISAFLGELSFPVYLLHVLVICSVGSSIYLRFGGIPAIVCVFLVTILAALPLMIFNDWWVARVNTVAEMLLRSRRPLNSEQIPASTEHATCIPVASIAKHPVR
jgi:peptidoglycan/LPS O-acetylase OafA/YrhL